MTLNGQMKKGDGLNLLMVTDVSMESVIGGAERVLYEQATRLVRRGHTVHVLTAKSNDYDSQAVQVDGVKEWRFNVDRTNGFTQLFTTLFNARRAFEVLHRRYHYHCLKIHQPFAGAGVLTSGASREIKRIYTCHSLSHEEFVSRNPRSEFAGPLPLYLLNVWLRKMIEKTVIRSCDNVTVLSRFTREKIIVQYGIPKKKIRVVPGGVDLKKFHAEFDLGPAKRSVMFPQNRIHLFTVRNLVQRMGLENLIQAMRIVCQQMPNVHLVIGGSGMIKSRLETLTRELNLERHIRFDGFIPEERLPVYYRAADLFVLPTLELEGFGLVTVEALASGTPVVGTPIGGTKEILSRFDRTYLFDNVSAEAISRRIIEKCRVIEEAPEVWRRIRHRSRKFVEQNYSWDRNIQLIESLTVN